MSTPYEPATDAKTDTTMSAHNSSATGAKTTGGMASATTTPANAHLGADKPKAFDAEGAIGKQFTGTIISRCLRLHFPSIRIAQSIDAPIIVLTT